MPGARGPRTSAAPRGHRRFDPRKGNTRPRQRNRRARSPRPEHLCSEAVERGSGREEMAAAREEPIGTFVFIRSTSLAYIYPPSMFGAGRCQLQLLADFAVECVHFCMRNVKVGLPPTTLNQGKVVTWWASVGLRRSATVHTTHSARATE